MLQRRIPFIIALIPLVVLIVLQIFIISSFGADALMGASQVGLLVTSAVAVLISVCFYRFDYSAFEEAISKSIASVSTAIVMLMLIGSLSGSWMISGIVPYLIKEGLQIISPAIFLPTSCILCALISIVTGSSWTTIATIGIALIGVGRANGFDDGWTAGAIISGAYFGDKMSPLSDTTVLASSTVGTPLFEHIKYMTKTTVPTLITTILIYSVASILMTGEGDSSTDAYIEGIESTFCVSHWLLVVPFLTGYMIYKKIPAVPVMFFATLMGVVASLIFQDGILEQIGEGDIFKGAMTSVFGATNVETGNEELNNLVATGGIAGVMNTIWLIICAMVFGGVMTAGGFLEVIMEKMVAMATRAWSLVSSTVASGIILNAVTCDQYLAVILTGSLFKDKYKKLGYEQRLLSRTVEDGTTVTSVLVPWSTCGMTQATILGVATITYLPYCFFNYLSPIATILMSLRIKEKSPNA
ncbi:MAG: Na+/H+ antiporter NhaC family protein [Bacteroidia bacterium]|nr:Na+/H+ antiporter NhaC family protein [Bacteroidia bacterium]